MDYTKIRSQHQSNYWYNDGLEKGTDPGSVRGHYSLFGEVLQYNRENIAARNLLGLGLLRTGRESRRRWWSGSSARI